MRIEIQLNIYEIINEETRLSLTSSSLIYGNDFYINVDYIYTIWIQNILMLTYNNCNDAHNNNNKKNMDN